MTEISKTALVTGASAGIGRAIAESLLAQGYTVLNLSRRKSDYSHERLIDAPVDLSDIEATEKVAKQLCEQHKVSTLILNAGVIKPNLIEDVDLADVEYLARLHLYASIALLQACLPAMREASFGRVVVISSRAMLGLETRTAYSATKAGQIGLTRTWALELGQFGITVNAVAPGPIVTDMFTEVVPEESDKAAAIAASIPVKRLGKADDVARAVDFLISPENGFVTGQCLFVCGGASLGSLAL